MQDVLNIRSPLPNVYLNQEATARIIYQSSEDLPKLSTASLLRWIVSHLNVIEFEAAMLRVLRTRCLYGVAKLREQPSRGGGGTTVTYPL